MTRDHISHDARTPKDRLNDHAAIDRLTDDLLPALVAKLGASGLGELEVREGTWRVRLRMPTDGHAIAGRRPTSGRPAARATDGPHGDHPRADAAGPVATGRATAAAGHAPEAEPAAGPSRIVATSPAVGYFRPRADLRAGARVRAGDRIGSVDVLGIGQDLVAPGDGLIGATLVEAGEPVEYGQAVIVLEQLTDRRPDAASPAESGPDATPAGPSTAAGDTRMADRDDPDGAPAGGVA